MSIQIHITEPGEELRGGADQSLQAMARLLAVAGHDLKQPIQIAMLSIAVAAGKITSAPVARRLRTALDAMRRLNSELDDIARLSQLGTTMPRTMPVDLDGMLYEVERDWRAYADECGTVLQINSSPVCVQSDPAMLKTILRNLVGNAIRHAGPRGHVSLSCMRRGGTLQIDVQDDGNGIAVGQLSRIFDAFERCGGASSHDGLGLGLTIVRQTAEMLRHPISVRSVENEGSTFSIDVPLLGPRISQPMDAGPFEPSLGEGTQVESRLVSIFSEEDGVPRQS